MHCKLAIVALGALALGTACSEDQEAEGPQSTADLQTAFEWNLKSLLSKDRVARRGAYDVCERNWKLMQDFVRQRAGSKDQPQRMACAYLLARLGTEEDLPVLRKLLHDDVERVRTNAVRGVGRLGDKESVPALRAMATAADVLYPEHRYLMKVLAGLDAGVAYRVCQELTARKDDWAKRRVAVQTMGLLDTPESAKQIEAMLDDENWMVRMDAVRSVGSRHLLAARPKLLELLKDRQEDVRCSTLEALGALAQQEDLKTLAHLAQEDKAKMIRVSATLGLGGFAEAAALPFVRKVLENQKESHKVRYAAITSLRRWPSETARELVRAALASDKELAGMDAIATPAKPAKD